MINKDIEEITKGDLQALIDNEVIEHKTIEYKKILLENSDKEKKEFLADVSSFANASAGDIIYGITEDKTTGKPKSLNGLDIENPDQEIQRLDNIIRTGIQLSLLGVRGYFMAIHDYSPFRNTQTIDRDVLKLPEFIVENYDVKAENILKSSFDSIWNACGFRRSFNYDENEEWAPK